MQRPTVLLGLSFALLLSGAVAAIADTPLAGNAYRWVLLLLVGTIVWAASPSRTVFGERTAAFDTACAIAILALFGPDVMRIADAPVLPALRYLSPIGLLGIIVCAAWRSTRPARADGALAALRIAPDARFSRAAVSAFLLLLFAAAVAGPALLLVAGLVPLPTVAVIVGVILIALSWNGMRVRRHLSALAKSDGILLAIATALLARFLIEVLFPISAGFSLLAASSGILDAVLLLLSISGGIAIALMLFVIWRALLLLRSTRDHAHLPRWPARIVGLMIALTSAAVLITPLHLSWSAKGVPPSIVPSMSAHSWVPLPQLTILFLIISIGFAAWMASAMNDTVRRYLMVIPMAAAMLSLFGYALLAFATVFAQNGAAMLFASMNGWYAAVVTQGVLFAMTGIAIFLGACGFLYEIARD